ncbi:MAG TPA: isoleucine--tRNA ligase [Dehalococcoidia bacterium]|nr:isoleucine--tRNA ligase [Dehalococcoidia bacterium]
MPFKPVPTRVDFVRLEHEVQEFWDRERILAKYLKRNVDAPKRWSFIDGPITANNPMGVHHAWGRSYKDLYQRLHTMQGYEQRYQNGFDCQGLWIEVEVEKEMGFKSKKDIETFGIDRFVEACKERVRRFSKIQTQQSIRLGYWMDWDNSYYTNSDENNYTIWLFLKKCWERGWIYKGKDAMPWCPRCGTGISQHEIVTEGYQEITHKSVYLKFPLTSSPLEGGAEAEGSLLVWTTTPWTLAANVAAAVHPDLTYVLVRQGDDLFYVSKGAVSSAVRGDHEVVREVKGAELVGLTFRGPFDELPAQQGIIHRVIAWDEVSDAEGTGIVHIAPGAGAEDFALSKEHGLEVIAPLEEDGTYIVGDRPGMRTGFGFLEGKFAGDVSEEVFASLREKGLLYRVQDYTHRYPTCWRCGSELVFRLVDEWFISMDGRKQEAGNGAGQAASQSADKPLRERIMEVARKARWIPEFGLARELDWLKNMHDWMISKKRYYGLALPIFECEQCGHFEVIGSEHELKERAVEGWEEFEGHSPHRPYIDPVRIACSKCGAKVPRIKDVGNPWLDAGIVPFSTLGYRHNPDYWRKWFPADWVSESFPGQFRNWFYSLLAMGTVMVEGTEFEGQPPFKTLFSYALLRDEKGEEMHKSKGNAIWFDDAAERMGADVMRWMYFRAPPANNLNFGWHGGDEIKRGFLSTLWNTYSFFVTYANIDGWTPEQVQRPPATTVTERPELDRWALSELNQLVKDVTADLAEYDSMNATRRIEEFVEGLSNWYVRRSRRRFWKSEDDADKRSAYETLWTCLETLSRLLAPMLPFLAEEMWRNLTLAGSGEGEEGGKAAAESVHLCDWPQADEALIDRELQDAVRLVQRLASLGRAARAKAGIKVRQPLQKVHVKVQTAKERETVRLLAEQLMEELNVKDVELIDDEAEYFEYQVRPNLPVLGPKLGPRIGELQRALAAADKVAVAKAATAGRQVELDGFTLEPSELLVTTQGRLGYAAAEDAGYAAVVTTEITPELADEGLARELVRRIQEMRKDAGFEISDRIRLTYEGHEDIVRVMQSWRDYIAQETLAQAVELSPPPPGSHSESHDVDGRRVLLAVVRV